MPKKNGRIKRTSDSTRTMGPEGAGSSGDMRDRFRDVYKPGANPPPKPGFENPVDVIKGILRKKKPKK